MFIGTGVFAYSINSIGNILQDIFKKKNEFAKAMGYYEQALQRDVASKNEIETLKKKIADCKASSK